MTTIREYFKQTLGAQPIVDHPRFDDPIIEKFAKIIDETNEVITKYQGNRDWHLRRAAWEIKGQFTGMTEELFEELTFAQFKGTAETLLEIVKRRYIGEDTHDSIVSALDLASDMESMRLDYDPEEFANFFNPTHEKFIRKNMGSWDGMCPEIEAALERFNPGWEANYDSDPDAP